MGRKTYEVALTQRSGMGSGSPGMKTYVLSRSWTQDPDRDRDVEIISRDAVEFVGELRQREGKDICVMGGGELAKPLLEAGLIDEITLNIHPVLLGSGVPLFRGLGRQIALELLDCQPFQNGCIYATYRLVP